MKYFTNLRGGAARFQPWAAFKGACGDCCYRLIAEAAHGDSGHRLLSGMSVPDSKLPGQPASPEHAFSSGVARPLDQVVEAMRPSMIRAVPEPSSLSERAARVLSAGPADALPLMREVCRVERLKSVAAARMAEVLLGSRPDFVQLDDDRWALLRDGQVVWGAQRACALEMDVASSARGAPASVEASATAAPVPVRPAGALAAGALAAGALAADALAADAADASVAPVVRRTRARPDLSPELASMRFAVVDVETTGSHTNGADRITEIAIVPVQGLQVGEPWEQLVQPGKLIPPFIQALTGISNAMVANAPMFHEIADEVIARLDGQLFTAHNAAFDRRFVASELLRTRHIFLDGHSLCTVRLARRLLPTLPRRSLDRVCEHFGIANAGRHRAGGDALATAHCLVRMLHIAQDDGLTTWAQLQRFLSGPTRRTAKRSALPSPVREDTSA